MSDPTHYIVQAHGRVLAYRDSEHCLAYVFGPWKTLQWTSRRELAHLFDDLSEAKKVARKWTPCAQVTSVVWKEWPDA